MHQGGSGPGSQFRPRDIGCRGLRSGESLSRRTRRCRLFGFGRCRIRRGDIVDFFLEPSERFADSFTDLWELSRPKNDEDNDEDNDEFRDPHGTKHGVIPLSQEPVRQSAVSLLMENQINFIGL